MNTTALSHVRRSLTALAALGLCAAWALPAAALPVPPGVSPNNPRIKQGLLDVSLYNTAATPVDPTGVKDSTKAIQKAIHDGYEYGLAVYLPAGTYLVSDTLEQEQIRPATAGCTEVFSAAKYGTPNDRRKTIVLMGPSSGGRAVLRLKDNSAGFGSAAKEKPVLHFLNADPTEPGVDQSACAFGLVVRGVDFVLGKGNAGAVGIAMPSAQWSAIEDVHINATGAYAGIHGLPARGGSANIEVVGGQYGIIADNFGGMALTGLRLRKQTVASLEATSRAIVTVTGFDLQPAAGGQAVVFDDGAGLSLYQGAITMADGKTAIANVHKRNMFLGDVYVRATGNILDAGPSGAVKGSSGWQRIDKYSISYAGTPAAKGLVEGKVETKTVLKLGVAGAPPADIVTAHELPVLPWPDNAGVKNVKDADIGAKGDGVADDSAALQKAIDKHDTVFLPRGDYRLGKALVLHPKTRLFGLPGHLTRLVPSWSPAAVAHAVITDDAAGATTFLGDVEVLLPQASQAPNLGSVDWRAGGASVMNMVSSELLTGGKTSGPRALLRFRQSGGGRVYGYVGCRMPGTTNKDFRQILVDGTSEPLTFYGPNTEHGNGDFQIEVRNAANVRILGTKSETVSQDSDQNHSFGHFKGNDNLLFLGLSTFGGGNGPNRAVVFEDNTNVLGANLTGFVAEHNTPQGPMLVEIQGAKTVTIDGHDDVSRYERGAYDESQFYVAHPDTDAVDDSVDPVESTDPGDDADVDEEAARADGAIACSYGVDGSSAPVLPIVFAVALGLAVARRRRA